jgi:uridine kinase
MGEAAGEADFAVRLVDPEAHSPTNVDGEGEGEKGDMRGAMKPPPQVKEEGFKVPVKVTEDLKFSRKRGDEARVTEKRAWVVSPGESVIPAVIGDGR